MSRVYIAPVKFDKEDNPSEMGTSKRSFCTECSAMLWNYHDEYPKVSQAATRVLRVHLKSNTPSGSTPSPRPSTSQTFRLYPKAPT